MEELDSVENWNQAEEDIDRCLEQASRLIPARKVRQNAGHSRKQFQLMTVLVAVRNDTIRKVL